MEPIPAPARAYRSLLARYLRPRRAAAGSVALVLLASMALPLAAPQVIARFIDRAVGGAVLDELLRIAVVYLAIAVGAQILAVAAAYASTRLAWDVTNRMRADVAGHVLGLDLAFHGRHTPGEMIERVDGDVAHISDFFAQFILQVIGSALLLAGVLVVVFLADVVVGAALTVFAFVAVAVLHLLRDTAVPAATADREATAAVYGNLEERLAGAEDLRANGAGAHVLRHYHLVNAPSFHAFVASERAHGRVWSGAYLLFSAGSALSLVLGVWLQRRGAISVGTVYLLFQYTQMVRRPLEAIADQMRQFQMAAAGAERVAGLLALRPSLVDPPRPAPLPTGPLGVELVGVSFAYERGDTVLHDVSLRVAPGEVLGVVGRTASGKTTLGRLLVRLYDVDAGAVRVGDVDVRNCALADLRRRVGIVTQDVQLFRADLRDNLTVFGAHASDARLVTVLEEVGLGDWYAALPEGLSTQLGPGGSGLSAGEAQLLAFARVFLADPGLVVLDEASSRLDPGTEARIETAVDRLLAGRTAIVVAHRLATLDRADAIAVVDHGRLVEYGPRTELARSAGRFAELLAIASGGSA